MRKRRVPQLSALRIYWYKIKWDELKPAELRKARWSAFNKAVFRLVDIEDQLAEISRVRDILKRFHRACQIIELYLYRAYELRERVVGILIATSGKSERVCGEIKSTSKEKRHNCIAKLRPHAPEVIDEIGRLMDLLDDDIALRNMQTHRQYFGIGLLTPTKELFDPDDVLMECEHNPTAYREVLSILQVEVKRLVTQYRERIRAVINAANAVFEAAHPAAKLSQSTKACLALGL